MSGWPNKEAQNNETQYTMSELLILKSCFDKKRNDGWVNGNEASRKV